MSKCDENGCCPFQKWWRGIHGTGVYQERSCGVKPDDCRLTSKLFPIINAMIAGEWKCETCGISDDCLYYKWGDGRPCAWWEPKPKGE